MRRRFAWLLAILSGFYLVFLAIIPDPFLFFDEGLALLVFVKSMAYLGHDVRKWIPFLGKGKKSAGSGNFHADEQTVDV